MTGYQPITEQKHPHTHTQGNFSDSKWPDKLPKGTHRPTKNTKTSHRNEPVCWCGELNLWLAKLLTILPD